MFSFTHKTFIVEQLKKAFESDLSTHIDSAQSAYEAATHAESRADNKYDTRGLEASYLAGAQAQRSAEIRKLLGLCSTLEIKSFGPDAEISISALVEVQGDSPSSQWIFLVPFAGGQNIEVLGRKVQIVSSASPLGSELMGRRAGDDFELEMRGREIDYRILQAI